MIQLNYGNLTALVAPEKGATVVQLTRDGVDFLYRDDENLRSPERPRCGIPFLFPIFGRLKDARYIWEGKTYHMDIHGFAHTSPWSVESATENTALLVLESNAGTLAVYPFPFRVEMALTLNEQGLTIGLTFRNTGTTPLPYNYGFHPYFLTEKLENLRVDAQAAVRVDFATGQNLPFGHDTLGLTIPAGAPEAGAALAGISAPTVLQNPAEGRQVTMEYDDSFNQLVLWSQAGKKFLCVEPINGSPDSLNTGRYMTLAPGQSRSAFLRLNPLCIGKE